jgi:hypothetical protein
VGGGGGGVGGRKGCCWGLASHLFIVSRSNPETDKNKKKRVTPFVMLHVISNGFFRPCPLRQYRKQSGNKLLEQTRRVSLRPSIRLQVQVPLYGISYTTKLKLAANFGLGWTDDPSETISKTASLWCVAPTLHSSRLLAP